LTTLEDVYLKIFGLTGVKIVPGQARNKSFLHKVTYSRCLEILSSLWFKFLAVSIFILTVFSFFYIASLNPKNSDPSPSIKALNTETAKKFSSFTVHVNVGMVIRNFSKFNLIENKFIADIVVWFLYNSEEVELDTLEKFSFERGKVLSKTSPDIKLVGGKSFARYNITAEFYGDFRHYKFPRDNHSLSIVITNNFVTPQEVLFDVTTTDFYINPRISVSSWKIIGLRTNFGIDEDFFNQIDLTKKSSYPKAVFTIDFSKNGFREEFVIFVPIFIVFMFSLFSMFFSIKNLVGRATLSVSAVSALLGYRFVIERMMPKVGYFTTTDHVYMILLFVSFLVMILHVVITRLAYNYSLEKKQKLIVRNELILLKDGVFVLVIILTLTLLGIVVM
jgi:hypothetical protein